MYRKIEGNNILLLIEILKLDRIIALITIKDDYPKSTLSLYNSILIEVLDLF